MKLNRALNLVIQVERDDGVTVYVHAQPIGREVFETYALPLAKTFAAIVAQGLGTVAGPRVAALVLKEIAAEMGRWEGPGGVEQGLMPEIRRLANVVAPGEKGWTTLPLEDALRAEMLGEDDASEVLNALVFFTLSSRMNRRADLPAVLSAMELLWGAQTSSLDCTAFANSLPTSKETANSGATAAASQVPS